MGSATLILHDLLLKHLEHVGVSDVTMKRLRDELDCLDHSTESSDLQKVYAYCFEDKLTISVQNLSGLVCHFDASPICTVRELKEVIAERTGVPVQEQHLFYGECQMHEGACLTHYFRSPLGAAVSLVRSWPPRLFVNAGMNGEVAAMNLASRSWTWEPSRPNLVAGSAAVVVDRKLYLIGGRLGGVPTAKLEMFDPVLSVWKNLPSMKCARLGFASAPLDGKIYVAGGLDRDFGELITAEVFDPQTGMWDELPNMSMERDGCAGAAVSGKFYVLGGNDIENTPVDFVEALDPSTRTWSAIPPMIEPRADLAAVAVHTHIYAVGGHSEEYQLSCLASAEVFDLASGEWSMLPPMRRPRVHHSAVAIDGYIYVLGGKVEDRWENGMELYDMDKSLWCNGTEAVTEFSCSPAQRRSIFNYMSAAVL